MGDNPAPVSMILKGEQYELLASDDKTAFILRSKADGSAAHLQGDDATRFLADYETVQKQFPDGTPDQALAQLWDQGGYSWLAAEEAD